MLKSIYSEQRFGDLRTLQTKYLIRKQSCDTRDRKFIEEEYCDSRNLSTKVQEEEWRKIENDQDNLYNDIAAACQCRPTYLSGMVQQSGMCLLQMVEVRRAGKMRKSLSDSSSWNIQRSGGEMWISWRGMRYMKMMRLLPYRFKQ
ncbi:hypothetical protein NEOLI_003980 [Neolecta irregularis DAH-3]|uniref:Uncharacterized protein n=1 Tax=Neolecta irregularis (strain DAH-3) TaxID=1198029 RepID=A0A1U7LPM1_NEOID|nr:hypothetical protein NEOLI_003980 [Neolecta irregularis DAH-3]|eukprot:OLL24492.1 hypothetical protein NEOLI_003980 [Neolecta irregularis DAH-3]